MKKVLFLLVLPLMLVSCQKKQGQVKVSFAEFCLHWKSPSVCKKADIVSNHVVIDRDSENWSAVSTEEDVPEEQKHVEDDNAYIFDEGGSCIPDHEPITTRKPYILTIDYLNLYAALVSVAQFYINPLRVVVNLTMYQAADDNPSGVEYYAIIKDDITYNDQMWITSYTSTTMEKSYLGEQYGWKNVTETDTYSYTYFE